MNRQTDIFEQAKKERYEAFKTKFYAGVRERVEKRRREFERSKFVNVSINPKNFKP